MTQKEMLVNIKHSSQAKRRKAPSERLNIKHYNLKN